MKKKIWSPLSLLFLIGQYAKKNIYIFFETTEQIKIKLDRNDVWKVLYKHSSFHFDKTKNMAATRNM